MIITTYWTEVIFFLKKQPDIDFILCNYAMCSEHPEKLVQKANLQLEPEQQPYQALEKDTAEQVAI